MATPLASQFIARLESLVAKHGDLPLQVMDADTGWMLDPGLIGPRPGFFPQQFEITTDYKDNPEGSF